MAVEVLLQYSDPASPQSSTQYASDGNTGHLDSYDSYLTFGHILYENSPRYVLSGSAKYWHRRWNYQGNQEPEVREEAFPKLWQQQPEALIKLLLESNCHLVHHFAVKAVKDCPKFCEALELNTLIKLLDRPYEITAGFAFELARDRYDANNPNLELILGLANCLLAEARQQAYSWIDAQRQLFLNNTNFIASLVTSKQQETRKFAGNLLSSSILTDDAAKVLIGQIIIQVIAFNRETVEIGKIIDEITDTLLTSLSQQLRKLGMGVILDLLRHPLPEVQELGARILLNHETPAADLPPELIESLIESPYEGVRGIGIRIFGQLPDETLMGSQKVLILAMAINSEEDIRNSIKPIIARLAATNSQFATELAGDLIEFLLVPEKHDGVHSYLLGLLRNDVPGWMTNISREKAMQLLRAKSDFAKELGGWILQANFRDWIGDFPTVEIVKLASNQILSVRQAAWQMFSEI